ncbi:MAG: glycosyltransferase [Pseudomonadota bacterium]
MRIWILKDSEQLPLTPDTKPMRVGMLSEQLQQRGHAVHWWCSTIHHMKKTLYATQDTDQTLSSGVQLHMLHAGLYTRNLSLARIRHHRQLAKRWRAIAEQSAEAPQLILVAYPLIEWVREALRYARPRGIPVIVDVRDQWPDSFANYAPAPLKPFVRLATWLLYPYARRSLRAATRLTSMSGPLLQWALTKSGRMDGAACPIFYLGTPLSEPPITPAVAQPGEVIRVCFLGTLGHTADALTIAKAATILAQQGAPIHITLAGNGDVAPALRDYLDGRDLFSLPGWLDQEAGRQLLASSHIALLTGDAEAMPNRFFDYVAAGLPIVCSLRGEVRAYIEQHQLGRTCPAGDAAALAQAIRDVADALPTYRAAVTTVPPVHYSKQAIYTAFAEFLENEYAAATARNA